jgi:hypothetical protein
MEIGTKVKVNDRPNDIGEVQSKPAPNGGAMLIVFPEYLHSFLAGWMLAPAECLEVIE